MATQRKTEQPSRSNGGFEKKDALRAIAGLVALGFAGRSIMSSARRPRVLGVQLPREMTDTRQLAKRLSKLAAQIEHASEDVRVASAQTKRVADRLS